MQPYNPLDKDNLAKSVVDALRRCDVLPLSQTSELTGAGIYAIYYVGDLPIYGYLAAKNQDKLFEQPIYVGKAIPEGSRKGGVNSQKNKRKSQTPLRKRLSEHRSSIRSVAGLRVEDFFYRYLVVDDVWIPLGERMAIAMFQPVWNVVVDGFGIHTPGRGRKRQARSLWDTLHPGRKLAKRHPKNALAASAIETRLLNFFAGRAVPEPPSGIEE